MNGGANRRQNAVHAPTQPARQNSQKAVYRAASLLRDRQGTTDPPKINAARQDHDQHLR
jgi:hypothetical protein